MRIVMFCHSLRLRLEPRQRAFPARRRAASCSRAATTSRVYEPRDAWSRREPRRRARRRGARRLRARLSRRCAARATTSTTLDLDAGARRRRPGARPRVERPRAGARASARTARAHGGYRLLFHDTHHRAVTEPDEHGRATTCAHYDGVLAFGDVIRDLYLRARLGDARLDLARGGRHARLPSAARTTRARATWSGSATGATTSARAELRRVPARAGARARAAARVTACAIPSDALRALARRRASSTAAGCRTTRRRDVFARYRVTVHVPRRPYVAGAAGHPDDPRRSRRWPAASRWSRAPWDDAEGLFTPGADFLVARDGARDDARICATLLHDADARARRSPRTGCATILARHTCAHRVDELLAICASSAPRRDAARATPA